MTRAPTLLVLAALVAAPAAARGRDFGRAARLRRGLRPDDAAALDDVGELSLSISLSAASADAGGVDLTTPAVEAGDPAPEIVADGTEDLGLEEGEAEKEEEEGDDDDHEVVVEEDEETCKEDADCGAGQTCACRLGCAFCVEYLPGFYVDFFCGSCVDL